MTLFSSTPTFTQGLVLGQLSILLLLAFILRYLFFDTNLPPPSTDEDESDADARADEPKDSGHPIPTHPLSSQKHSFIEDFPVDATRQESLEWFNLLLNEASPNLLPPTSKYNHPTYRPSSYGTVQLTQTYRAHLRGNLTGTAANEAARRRVERWAQTALQSSMMVFQITSFTRTRHYYLHEYIVSYKGSLR